MWEFTHDETIDASPEAVFSVMSDLPRYQEWNPFLVIARGRVETGGVVSGKSALGKVVTSYRHKIVEYVPNKALCWRDFGFPALFVCRHRARYVEERDGRTYYTCNLRVSGLLSGVVNLIFGNGLRNGIVAEAQALGEEAARVSQELRERPNDPIQATAKGSA